VILHVVHDAPGLQIIALVVLALIQEPTSCFIVNGPRLDFWTKRYPQPSSMYSSTIR
jgi:hypothetical protein